MELEATPLLRNRYWILRHGKSIPNEKGLIVSSMENGTLPEYQLAPDGVIQAQLAGELFQKELKERNIPYENVRICYSPFSRTTQTAQIAASVLNIPLEGPQCKVVADLRERYFGPSYELMSHEKYRDIWALDEKDPFEGPEGGESVDDVASRLGRALALIESEFEGCAILVVSHGDPLQLLQTIVNGTVKTKQQQQQQQQATVSNSSVGIESRINEVRTSSVLSQHRKFSMLTAELRSLA